MVSLNEIGYMRGELRPKEYHTVENVSIGKKAVITKLEVSGQMSGIGLIRSIFWSLFDQMICY